MGTRWTVEEVRRLRQAVGDATSWEDIYAAMPERPSSGVRYKCWKLGLKPMLKRKWGEREQRLAKEAWEAGIPTETICELTHRSGNAMRNRMMAVGAKRPTRKAWSHEETQLLSELVAEGRSWVRIAKRLEGRSPAACEAKAKREGLIA